MQYYKIDENGHYLEPVIANLDNELPFNITNVPPPQPCWNPQWTGDKWVELNPSPTEEPPEGKRWQWNSEQKKHVLVDES